MFVYKDIGLMHGPLAASYLRRRFRPHPSLLLVIVIFLVVISSYHVRTPTETTLGLRDLGGFRSSTNYTGFWHFYGSAPEEVAQTHAERRLLSNPNNLTTTLVVGRVQKDRKLVDWIHEKLIDVTSKAIYVVDDPNAPLHLSTNKGREAMVYVKYILNNYDHLNDITLFFHPHEQAWHNNILFDGNSPATINHMRRDYVMEQGYVNSRCDLHPGCPSWIKYNADDNEREKHKDRFLDLFTPELWEELFPGNPMPNYLAEACCSQFAVSRETIRAVPFETYLRIHDWLAKTSVWDAFTGRIMEYMWQYLFLGQEEYCPAISDCYCNLYGICLEDSTILEEYTKIYRLYEDWDNRLPSERLGHDGKLYTRRKDVEKRYVALSRDLPHDIGPGKWDQ